MVDCLTRADAEHLLETAKKHSGSDYPVFFTALRTAARQGELIALAWDAIDWRGGFLTIRSNATDGEVSTPKNGKTRRVPMTPQLLDLLKDHRRRASEAALAAGKTMSPWVFPGSAGGPDGPLLAQEEICSSLEEGGAAGGDVPLSPAYLPDGDGRGGDRHAVLQVIAGHTRSR